MSNFIRTISLIGLGGIGSWFVTPFLRFLSAEGFTGEITLADGDKFSAENVGRQNVDHTEIGLPKVTVFTNRLALALPGLRLRTFTEYVSEENVATVIKDGSLVVVAVDNHPARALISRHAGTLRDTCVLSAGNEKYDGNVHVYLRRAGRDMSVPLLERHPEIAKARSGDRAEMGCEQLAAAGEPQLLVTNFMAATALLVAFHAVWEKEAGARSRRHRAPLPQEVYFDVRQQAMSAIASIAPVTSDVDTRELVATN